MGDNVRRIRLLNIRPVHERGEPSRITLNLGLEYLKGMPVATIDLSEDEALRLAEAAIRAVIICQESRR